MIDVLLIALFGLAADFLEDVGPPNAVVDLRGGAVLIPADVARRLTGADVVILGEVHDNPLHHRRQAYLLTAIDPEGVAFEMVPEALEAQLQDLSADEMRDALDWDNSGWPDWSLYSPLFKSAAYLLERDEAFRLAGGGVSREDIQTAMAEGAAAAWQREPDAGLGDPLPEEERAAMKEEMIDAHCGHLPADMADGMIEAQRLRDARFALATLRARGSVWGGEGISVLITGNGHARLDRGVPRYLQRLAPGLKILTLGQIEKPPGGWGDIDVNALPYDVVWFSEAAEREDPCEAFFNRGSGG